MTDKLFGAGAGTATGSVLSNLIHTVGTLRVPPAVASVSVKRKRHVFDKQHCTTQIIVNMFHKISNMQTAPYTGVFVLIKFTFNTIIPNENTVF